MGNRPQPIWDGETWVQSSTGDTPNQEPVAEASTQTEPATDGLPAHAPETHDSPGNSFGQRLRSVISRHPLLSAATCFAVGLVIAGAIAAAIAIPKINDLTDQRDSTSAQLANTQQELTTTQKQRNHAQEVAARIRGQRDQIISSAKAQAGKMVNDAKQKVDDLNQQLQQTQSNLTSTQSKLDSVNASLQQAQQTKQMSTFSDGTWSVGSDVLAGSYRSTAGGNCYWEILKSPSGGGIGNIVDNGFGPNATISVSTGQWLHVDGCGTWQPGP